MLNLGGDEEHASRGDFPVLISGLEARFSADDVVHLIFMMGALRVGGPGGQYVEPRAQGRHAQKLAIQFAARGPLPVDRADVPEPRLHARIPPKSSSVNCGIRWCACSSPSGLYHW